MDGTIGNTKSIILDLSKEKRIKKEERKRCNAKRIMTSLIIRGLLLWK